METKNKERRLNFLLGRGWFKSKKLEDRDIDFTVLSKREEIIMPEEERLHLTPVREEPKALNAIMEENPEDSQQTEMRPEEGEEMPEEERLHLTESRLHLTPVREEPKVLNAIKERRETSTNDELRTKRKVVSFVSGEDYEELEKELHLTLQKLHLTLEKINEIRKIIN